MRALRLVRREVRRGCRLLVVLGLSLPLTGGGVWGAEARTPGDMLDLAQAVVVVPKDVSGPASKAVTLLIEEVHTRSQLHWPVVHTWPEDARPVIALGTAATLKSLVGRSAAQLANDLRADQPEGFQIALERKARRSSWRAMTTEAFSSGSGGCSASCAWSVGGPCCPRGSMSRPRLRPHYEATNWATDPRQIPTTLGISRSGSSTSVTSLSSAPTPSS